MLTDRLIGAAVSWGSRQIQKRVPYSRTNPYLEGAFAPVKTETTTTRLAIRGSIPHELQGILTGSVLRHDFRPHDVPSEAVFVPRAANAAEDDGWLFSYVYDIEVDRSSVVILNARDFDGEPQAVIELPVRVPLTFHGNGIPDGSR